MKEKEPITIEIDDKGDISEEISEELQIDDGVSIISKEEFDKVIENDFKGAREKFLIDNKKDDELFEEKKEENVASKKCQFVGQGDKKCNFFAVPGSNFCKRHNIPVPEKTETSKDVKSKKRGVVRYGLHSTNANTARLQDLIEQYKNSPDLETLDNELAYMKMLPNRIEDNESLTDADKVEAVQKVLGEIGKLAERRQKIIEAKKFYLEVSQISYFVRQVIKVIDKHVQTPEIRMAIKTDLQNLYLKRTKSKK